MKKPKLLTIKPDEYILRSKTIALDRHGKVILLDNFFESDEVLDESELTYNIIQEIRKILGFDDFYIKMEINCDGYFKEWYVNFLDKNPNYEIGMERFNNRYEIYQKELDEYYEKIKQEKKSKAKQRIEKLKKEIEKLENL